jgi:hypothetical protein
LDVFEEVKGMMTARMGVDEPGPAFFIFSGMGEIIFELSEELV